LTTGNLNDQVPGALGQPGTTVLYGGTADSPIQSGGQITLGYWFGDQHLFGIEGSGFYLARKASSYTASSSGVPILARPFFDTTSNTESAQYVAFAVPVLGQVVSTLAGSARIDTSTQLWGADINFRTQCFCGDWWNVGFLAGARFLGLDESLQVQENLTSLFTVSLPAIGTTNAGDNIRVTDRFGTSNQFYGGQIGSDVELRYKRWYVDFVGKLALGSSNESVTIQGATTFNTATTGMTSFNGGLLAQPTNMGHFSRQMFSIVPESKITVGYQLSDHLRIFASYNFLYWSNVVRPGDQIDRVVNSSQLPNELGPGTLAGVPRPAFAFRGSDFYAQGVSFGVELRY
jgi:hypothetical protein